MKIMVNQVALYIRKSVSNFHHCTLINISYLYVQHAEILTRVHEGYLKHLLKHPSYQSRHIIQPSLRQEVTLSVSQSRKLSGNQSENKLMSQLKKSNCSHYSQSRRLADKLIKRYKTCLLRIKKDPESEPGAV